MAEPTVEQLIARLERLLPVGFGSVTYRSSTPKYATEADLLTGEGSRRTGGRWNPKGIAAVYTSLTPETAMAETLAHNRYNALPIEDTMPRVFVAIAVNLESVVDLRDGAVRRRLQVSETKVLTVDWRAELYAGREPITQRLGRAVHATGREGLIVPSAADPDGYNLVVFPDHVLPTSTVTLLHADRLGPA
ncbi:MAG: RES family NAD+ phosphorylase [Gemmataceae bacterium]|nr:RES family NAD+ phosphorylase [Gemmataceae bacterium]